MIDIKQFSDSVLPFTLKYEGGYVNDSNDRGGETYRGIARRSNPDWLGWAVLEKYKPLNRGDIVNDCDLKNAIRQLYWDKYFSAHRFDQLNNLCLAVVLFDFAVHGGYSVARLQRKLNEAFELNLLVDGVFGPMTVAAINSLPVLSLCQSLISLRREHLEAIILRDPSQRKFEKGWMSRLDYLSKLVKTNLKS